MKRTNFTLAISDRKEIPEMCSVCGENDYRILRRYEKHHIFARCNSDEIILLCPNCHGKITSKQNSISPKKRKSKLAFMLLSIGKLLEIIGLTLQRESLKLLENG